MKYCLGCNRMRRSWSPRSTETDDVRGGCVQVIMPTYGAYSESHFAVSIYLNVALSGKEAKQTAEMK